MKLLVQFLLASSCRRFVHAEAVSVVKVKDAIAHWSNKFKEQNVSEPQNSIENIMCHILGSRKLTDLFFKMDDELSSDQSNQLETLCECRLARMPLQYIIKEWDFRDMTLKMSPPVFIPRPETEELIDIVLDNSPQPPQRILEVGCGTGAISLALLKSLPKATAIVVDKSEFACNLTGENAKLVGVSDRITVVHSKLERDGSLKNGPDLKDIDTIVSNPPYVPTLDLHKLQPEIKLFEDLQALDGGGNGMKIIIPLMILASNQLKKGGNLFIETDPKHPDMIEKWIEENEKYSLKFIMKFQDFYKKMRFVHIRKD